MKNVSRFLGGALLACAAASSVHAADWYGTVSAGASRWGGIDGLPAGVTYDRSDFGVKGALGLRLNPNVAFELGYAYLGKAKLGGTFNGAAVNGDISGDGAFIDVVGTLPLSSQWSLLGRLGAFNGRAKASGVAGSTSDRGTAVKWGFGGQYEMSPASAVKLEWERYRFDVFGGNGDVDLLSLGIVFRF